MKYVLVVTVIILFLSSFCFGQKDEWKEFTSKGSKFSINFPAIPQESKTKMPDGGNRYIFSVRESKRLLAVQVSDLTKTSGPLNEAALSVFYTIARQGGLDALKGSKLISETDIRLKGLLGRDYTIGNDETVMMRRVFMTEDRLYLISVTVPKTQEKDAGVAETLAKFFNSFHLLTASPGF